MSADTQAGLGDLARCLKQLAPRNERTTNTVSRMLGLELSATGFRPEADDAPQPPEPSPFPVPGEGDGTNADTPPVDEGPSSSSAQRPEADRRSDAPAASSPGADLDGLPLLARASPRVARRRLQWTVAEPLPPVADRHLYSRLRHEPLLQPRWSRELLFAAIASEVAGGSLDAAAAVDTVARGLALDPVPQLTRWSLIRGVQLLVDQGPGLEPFRGDAREVTSALRRVVGRSGVSEQRFESSLTYGVSDVWLGPRRPYTPPEPGTPVFVVSDLGMRPASPSHHVEWLDLARRLSDRGSPCVALVPYGPRRWPAELARRIVLIQWDRVTSVSAVRTARRAHGSFT